jgi:hypothetical protein
MDPAYISALAALLGSVIGGLTSLAASWLSQDVQARTQQRIADKTRREDLYKSFIEEASRVYGTALGTDEAEVTAIVALYAMVSRMRILSAPAVVEHAETVVRLIVDTYVQPNKTLRELRDVIVGGHLDPLREFSEACREDLGRFRPV